MCSSGFLQIYFIPSAKYQTATGILKRQKMLNKSYFSKAKKKEISKNKLGIHFSERLKKKKNETFSKKKEKKFHPKGQDVEAQAASEQELTPMDPLRSVYRFILELREVGGGP